MITGYVYTQKCKKKCQTELGYYILNSGSVFSKYKQKILPEFKIYQPFLFEIFITLLTINIANDHHNKSSFQTV